MIGRRLGAPLLGLVVAALAATGCLAGSASDDDRRFEGTVQVIVVDNFEEGTAQYHYLLRTEDGRELRLDLPDSVDTDRLQSGTPVSVSGTVSDDGPADGRVTVRSLEVLDE